MSNAQTTVAFFERTDSKTMGAILDNVAGHYGITRGAALAEVTDDDAESLLDYVTGPMRAAVSVLMQRHRLD